MYEGFFPQIYEFLLCRGIWRNFYWLSCGLLFEMRVLLGFILPRFPIQIWKIVFERLLSNARRAKVKKLRVSGGEPTLGKAHLLRLLDLVEDTNYFFFLETNGVLLGKEPEYVRALKKYRNLYVRVSIKAGTPEGFERRTGGKGEFYELPYLAVETLKKEGLYFRVAPMSDSRLMPKEERKEMVRKLRKVGYKDYLEEETCDPYDTSVKRLRKAGFSIF